MKSDPGDPLCYSCKYRQSLPDSAHSFCDQLAAMLWTRGDRDGVPGMRVTGDPHGILNGWFDWPYNFDPVWLDECTGYVKDGNV